MADLPVDSPVPYVKPPQRTVDIVWVMLMLIAVPLWATAFIASFMVTFSIELDQCGLDPLTEYETPDCAPVSAWSTATFWAWLGCPLVWILAGASVFSPNVPTRARRLALCAIPAFPAVIVAAHVLVYLLYGPLPA